MDVPHRHAVPPKALWTLRGRVSRGARAGPPAGPDGADSGAFCSLTGVCTDTSSQEGCSMLAGGPELLDFGIFTPMKGTERISEREGGRGPAQRPPSQRCPSVLLALAFPPPCEDAVQGCWGPLCSLSPGPGRREVSRGGPPGGGQRGLGGLLPERPCPAHGRAQSLVPPTVQPHAT